MAAREFKVVDVSPKAVMFMAPVVVAGPATFA
jgi:hypothetical protein